MRNDDETVLYMRVFFPKKKKKNGSVERKRKAFEIKDVKLQSDYLAQLFYSMTNVLKINCFYT